MDEVRELSPFCEGRDTFSGLFNRNAEVFLYLAPAMFLIRLLAQVAEGIVAVLSLLQLAKCFAQTYRRRRNGVVDLASRHEDCYQCGQLGVDN